MRNQKSWLRSILSPVKGPHSESIAMPTPRSAMMMRTTSNGNAFHDAMPSVCLLTSQRSLILTTLSVEVAQLVQDFLRCAD
jgi:hypothetical protein